ncbi:MAG TPA: dehydrogenase E1 component subunit alpha/beta [Solirubrobacterales bacterium]|nr:dehydrogenase E1 component subunit alpha/beta [Solirubrobacterales bacterium]
MSVSATEPVEGEQTSALLADEDRIGLLRHMLLMRAVEERGLSLYKQGKVPGSFYDGRGQEAISVGATWALGPGDPICSPIIRDLGAHLVRGTDLSEIFRHYMGRANGLSKGREGNIHFGDVHLGVVGTVSMLPDMMVVAVGIATAFKIRREARCAISFFGDGATSRGDWHEAMNMAAIDRLPVVFLLEDNQLAYSTGHDRQFAVDPMERAAGYGIPTAEVDGNDVEAVFGAVHDARRRALGGEGPTMVVARTMRMHGHGAHDDARYVEPEVLEDWLRRDPIERYAERLADLGLDLEEVRVEVEATVEEAVAAALDTPMADPADAIEDVFAPAEVEPEALGWGYAPWSGFATAPAAESRRPARPRVAGQAERPQGPVTFLKAISKALRDEMAADERVIVMGEDVGAFGGAFKVTEGLLAEFGAERVRDTPIAEAGIIGAAVGAAIEGLRPVCEMQFADFVACGFDQLVNVAAKMHYRLGLAVPMVLRLPSGGGFSGGPFHSQNPESWFMQAPGLKVVAPSTAADAYALLVAAIRDANPVVFLEHKNLYRRVKGELPATPEADPLRARVARAGGDATVIAYGAMVPAAVEAAEKVAAAGSGEVEVLDLRSLVPLDVEGILAAVRATSRVLIVDEANRTCAAGAEVASLIADRAFEDLDAPVRRLATPDVPIPFSPPLEQAVLPGPAAIERALSELLGY